LARGKPIEDRIAVEAVAAHDDVVICPPGHALASRRRVRVEELADTQLLLLDRTTGTRAYLDAAFERASVRPTVHMEMSSVEVLKRLVELGFGVSVVPKIAVGREIRDGSLVALSLSGGERSRKIGLVLPKVRSASPAARAFAEVVRASVGANSVET
jgi:DNA-binding transcriptional LysR family regulator